MEVKINVKNVHLAEITKSPEGVITYSVPEHVVGAMQIGRNPQIASGQLYGDGKVTHETSKKVKYELTVELNKLPTKWRRYMEGVTAVAGVESGTSADQPKPFAIGWEVEKTGGEKELIWFLYCMANPIQVNIRQSEDNITYSTDNLTISALEDDSLDKFYTLIDSEDADITAKMLTDFFKIVQISDTIAVA